MNDETNNNVTRETFLTIRKNSPEIPSFAILNFSFRSYLEMMTMPHDWMNDSWYTNDFSISWRSINDPANSEQNDSFSLSLFLSLRDRNNIPSIRFLSEPSESCAPRIFLAPSKFQVRETPECSLSGDSTCVSNMRPIACCIEHSSMFIHQIISQIACRILTSFRSDETYI